MTAPEMMQLIHNKWVAYTIPGVIPTMYPIS